MPQQVRGVIARSKGAPVEIATVNIPDPGPGEVVVDIAACGVCHTDLTYREGGINDEFPSCSATRLPASSRVSARASPPWPSATSSSSTGAPSAVSAAPASAAARVLLRHTQRRQKMTLEDGTELTPALGIGAFAEKTLVHAGQCTKVDPAPTRRSSGCSAAA